MSQCLTHNYGQCCCMKPHMQWCNTCQQYVCRTWYPTHRHTTQEERTRTYAQKVILAHLYARISSLT